MTPPLPAAAGNAPSPPSFAGVARRRWRWLCLAALTLGCAGEGTGNGVARTEPLDVRFRLASGPVEEVRIRSRSDGALVVSGQTYFPDGTRLTVALADSSGFTRTQTQPVVKNALFEGLPLRRADGDPWPPGEYQVHLSARFEPGVQDERVLRESENGRAFTGEGMTTTRTGHPVFSKTFRITR